MKKQRHKLIISEPWDFVGVDGKNLILGKIIKNVSDKCILFEADNLVTIDNYTGDTFVLYARHSENDLTNLKKYGSVNGGIFPKPISLNLNILDEKELESNSEFVLIGSLETN